MSLVRCDSWERPLAGGKGPKLFGLTLFSSSSRGGPGETSACPGSPLFLSSPRSQPSSPDKTKTSSPFGAAAAAASRAGNFPFGKSLRRQSSGFSRFASEAQAVAAAAAAELPVPTGLGLGSKLNSLSSNLSLPRTLSLVSAEEVPSLPGSIELRCSDETDSADSVTHSFPGRQSDTSTSQDVVDSGYNCSAPRRQRSPGSASPGGRLPPMARGASASLLQALSTHCISQPEREDPPANQSAAGARLSTLTRSVSTSQSNSASTMGSAGHAPQQPRRKANIRAVPAGRILSRSKREPAPGHSNVSSSPRTDLLRGIHSRSAKSTEMSRGSSPATVTSGATHPHCSSSHRPKRKAPVSEPGTPELGSSPSPNPKVPKKLGRKKLERHPCRVCGILDTPQWRRGPDGKRNLCNKCGVRLRKGLLPLPLPPYPSSDTGTESAAEGNPSAPCSPR